MLQRAVRFGLDVGLVLAGFILLLAFENVAVGVGYRAEFASTWEMYNARLYLSPLALASSIPVAVVLVALARRPRPRLLGALGAAFGAVVGVGLSGGRHLATLAVRIPFVLVLAAAGGGAAIVAARRLPRLRDGQIALLAVFVGTIAWLADAFLFERLYPAFHQALFALIVIAAAGIVLPLRTLRGGRSLSAFAVLFSVVCVAWTPHAAVRIATQDNLRRVLLEHAPVLGQAVLVASKLAPPPPLEDDEAATTTLTSLRDRNGVHALDWRGHDIVLITVDALRADHVSAYGYERRTTPYIDALAQHGVRFDHAYCPTPHTSYSVASMMTGKYMKSLLALRDEATGNDETAQDVRETWPVHLQRYGYRTAAFYPPAVFFIDEHRFRQMRDTHLGFEYAKVEFAGPALREQQVVQYLQSTPKDKPLFLWVHIFEPHEPYEMHPEHPFSGDPRVDAYDSEIAEADDIVGAVYKLVNEHRPPGAITIVSADHGEEHGDHGGRYHGTTVYEEQVRVPLVISVPGIPAHVVSTPVQTIDLLPTTLAALDIPIPPRLRGRDLGPVIAGVAKPGDDGGFAFAETDDYTLVARGDDRLVCARKIGSCTLFDVAADPAEKHAVTDRPARVAELRKLTAAIERETGRVEASGLPEALRRGLQGDVDAAEDVAPLLDDSRAEIRRLAAKCGFRLKSEVMKSGLARALARDEDPDVKRWSALALARMGDPAGKPLTDATLTDGNPDERVAAALALAEHGDGRGEGELVARWNAAFDPDTRTPGEVDEARALLNVFAGLKTKNAVPGLLRSLDDLRIRPFVVEALGRIGDLRAKEPLAALFANERYVHLRPLEARALLALGARRELLAPLTRFAGVPEPMPEALDLMREAKLLTPENGGAEGGYGKVVLSKSGAARLLIQSRDEPSPRINGVSAAAGSKLPGSDDVWVVEAGELSAGPVTIEANTAFVPARDGGQVEMRPAFWVVPRAEEIPPPPPKAWDAGAP